MLNSFPFRSVAILRSVSLFPIFLIILNSRKFNITYFINVYLAVVFLLSLLSIIQYFATPFGLVSFRSVDVGPLGAMYGFGGQGWFEETNIPRNVGFFSEPTNFAQMLMIPLFISLYKAGKSKGKKELVLFLVIGLAFFLTFSVANFFGLFLGILFYFYFKIKNPHFIASRKASVKFINLVIVLFIIYGIYNFYQTTNEYSYDSEVIIGKSTDESAIKRVERLEIYFSVLFDNPFGNLEFTRIYSSNPGFIGHVAIAGGFLFLGFWLLFLFNFIKKIFNTALNSKYLLVYCGLFSLIIPTFWDVQFWESQFLFYISFFTILVNYDLSNRKLF